MSKKRPVPESPLKGKPWPRDREQDLCRFLLEFEARFRSETSNPLPAFEALATVAAYFWLKEETPPGNEVALPWWVVEVIASGFEIYRESSLSTTPMTMGEAYNLEGRGQGKIPWIQREWRERRDKRIALAVAFEEANGVKIEAAI